MEYCVSFKWYMIHNLIHTFNSDTLQHLTYINSEIYLSIQLCYRILNCEKKSEKINLQDKEQTNVQKKQKKV